MPEDETTSGPEPEAESAPVTPVVDPGRIETEESMKALFPDSPDVHIIDPGPIDTVPETRTRRELQDEPHGDSADSSD